MTKPLDIQKIAVAISNLFTVLEAEGLEKGFGITLSRESVQKLVAEKENEGQYLFNTDPNQPALQEVGLLQRYGARQPQETFAGVPLTRLG